jgi:hypothetical protein
MKGVGNHCEFASEDFITLVLMVGAIALLVNF